LRIDAQALRIVNDYDRVLTIDFKIYIWCVEGSAVDMHYCSLSKGWIVFVVALIDF
jgi:hypothetical protein